MKNKPQIVLINIANRTAFDKAVPFAALILSVGVHFREVLYLYFSNNYKVNDCFKITISILKQSFLLV